MLKNSLKYEKKPTFNNYELKCKGHKDVPIIRKKILFKLGKLKLQIWSKK